MEAFSYIQGMHNPRRRHSRLGNRSPVTYEQLHRTTPLTDNQVSG
jgi:putative transposase